LVAAAALRGSIAALVIVAATPTSAEESASEHRRIALTLFGGQMSDDDWNHIATLNDVSLVDAYIAGAALTRELTNAKDWALEAEGQVVRHLGTEDHWEFNAALVARWRDFPWSESIRTSVAFGLGPSYATEVPEEEVARSGESARFLIYWVAELEIGPADSAWSGIARLHHRSNAFGLIDENGGSNWLTLGIRRRF
jgi:hypothetical protein